MSDLGITFADVRRCNRLRGLGVATCGCRIEAGWLECPPGALGTLADELIESCRLQLDNPGLAHGGILTRLPEVFALSRDPRLPARSEFTGDVCSNCQGVHMVRTGTCATCQDCGETAGCS